MACRCNILVLFLIRAVGAGRINVKGTSLCRQVRCKHDTELAHYLSEKRRGTKLSFRI